MDSGLYQEVKDLTLRLLELEENKPSYPRALCDSEDCVDDYQSYLEWSYEYRDTNETLKELLESEESVMDYWEAVVPESIEVSFEDIACIYVYLGGLVQMQLFLNGLLYTTRCPHCNITPSRALQEIIREARHSLPSGYSNY